jgi:hypothetical protein
MHKEMFPVYGGKCLSSKAVHNWVEKFSEGRSKVTDEARPGEEVAETAGFDSLVKRWEKCINISRNGCYFPLSKITCLMFYIHIWPIY